MSSDKNQNDDSTKKNNSNQDEKNLEFDTSLVNIFCNKHQMFKNKKSEGCLKNQKKNEKLPEFNQVF